MAANQVSEEVRATGQAFVLCGSSSLALDFIRGAASEAVVVGHGLILFGLANLPSLQNSGVVVFFLMSGFIIPYSSFMKARKDSTYGFGSYFIDRFSRIYVGFVPGLACVLLLDIFSQRCFPGEYAYSDAFDVRTFVGNLLMLQDHAIFDVAAKLTAGTSWLTSFGSARPFWTVAIEWWIYMVFGLIAFSTRRWRRSPVYWLALAVVAIAPAYNLVGGRGNGLSVVWGAGLLIYLLMARYPFLLSKERALAAGLALVVVAMARLVWARTPYDVLYALLLAGALYFILSAIQVGNAHVSRWISVPIKAVAAYSYTLYLVHYSVLVFLVHWNGEVPGGVLFVIGFVASNVISVILYVMFECRYRRVGARLKQVFILREPRGSVS